MMDYAASITYRTPITDNTLRAQAANEEGRFLGLRCPICDRTYVGGKGYCPIDSIELTAEAEVDLPQSGAVTNYTVITPIQYPGQTETEPFIRAHVLLDDVDVVMPYQSLIDVAPDDVRIGMRVAAVWASEAERGDTEGWGDGNLVGWIPTGEPDVEDPDLVNRVN